MKTRTLFCKRVWLERDGGMGIALFRAGERTSYR